MLAWGPLALHLVIVESRHGAIELPLKVDANVRAGELFATFHDPRRPVNRLTGRHRDTRAGTPEYKAIAVRVSAAGETSW